MKKCLLEVIQRPNNQFYQSHCYSSILKQREQKSRKYRDFNLEAVAMKKTFLKISQNSQGKNLC